MTQDLVLYETDAKVGFVTLNRPEKLNALSTDLRRELAATLTRADEDPATRVVVLRGAGRSFCVGYDLAGGSGSEAWRHDALKYHARLGASLALELMPWYMRKPVLASVQGHALGAGCELAMFCDLTIAADDAMFGEHWPLQSTLANKSKIPGTFYSLAVHCRRQADASRAIMISSAALPVTR